ncbi:mitochondrial import receptor subunit TOM7 homolog [Ursus americanus]|uniref:mitochondrial import receptor subunit TOM7 homolog n=1 Tax=Ursus arctos TaxID=9644 RepID=UPI001CF84434|nr:mitochondrial import receptor subunit TOM7 homolog [Ursus arctos]XP_045657697.1 mitochondrial import receptor subunit TOM7 homolog [Ursus americanus]
MPRSVGSFSKYMGFFRGNCQAVTMVKLSKEAKQRLQQLFRGGQFATHWSLVPVMIYLGFKRGADPGMSEPTIFSLLRG